MTRTRLRLALLLLCFCFRSLAADRSAENVRTPRPFSAQDERRSFHLPPGFELQLVAAEPDIAKPMNLAFDHKGRLWVTSSLEYPFPAQGRPGRDMVHVLEDFAPDGKARKISVFAKDLNIPIG